MSIDIRESRLIKIENRVIVLTDLQKLARIIWEEYAHIKDQDAHARVRFSASCDDESVFDSENINLFSNDSVLSSKRVTSITMSFDSYEKNANIDLRITHGESSSYDNRIKISGQDSKWVNGTLKAFGEKVESIKPQNRFFNKYMS